MDLETNILPPNPDKPGTISVYLANLLPKGAEAKINSIK